MRMAIGFVGSFAGKILPRPSDGKLRYVGGETRIISINKNSITYQQLIHKTFSIWNQPHIIKYQLPDEDLDALISVCSNEDLQHMIEEYNELDKCSQRLRIFLASLSPSSYVSRSVDQSESDYEYVISVNGMIRPSLSKDNLEGGRFPRMLACSEQANQPTFENGQQQARYLTEFGCENRQDLSKQYIVWEEDMITWTESNNPNITSGPLENQYAKSPATLFFHNFFHSTLWEDFTCLDASQCMLNKTILQVTTTYLESDISKCLNQLLALGTKMTLMSTGDSQEEEHYSLFFQVLLDMLSHSAAVLQALAKHPVSTGKELMSLIETFIMELLNMTKDSILEVKKIHTFGPEVLKASQMVLDAVISLCKAYFNSVKLDYDATTEKDDVNHIINITKCAVEKLVNLGIVAVNAGGDLVSVLNLSWKGVVALLQLHKGALAVKMDISEIILSLISLVKGSLSCAGQTWSTLMEPVSMAEAKRIFIPVKFYLINAARIISQYPSQAFSIFKDITLCILIILTFRIFLGEQKYLKSASEALTELLEPTSIHLLNSLLNSAQLEHNHKCQILDWLFSDTPISDFVDEKSTREIFSPACDPVHVSKTLLLGQLSLFVNLLRSGPDLEDDVTLEIAKKLNWLLNILIEENVYSSILAFPVPLLHNSGHQNMFSSVFHALKTFMLVVSSTSIWGEIELFLLENFFHPHHLCWEIIMELWCFLIRHADFDMGNDIIVKLCTILKSTASWESVLNPDSVLRKLVKSICMILRNDKVRSVAKQRLVTDYFCFLDAFDDESSRKDGDGMFGAPIFALSAALQSLMKQLYSSDEMEKVMFELQNLFISSCGVELRKCKPNLAAFVGDTEFEESDSNSKASASWELFHMLLQERHWALAHLAITAFGPAENEVALLVKEGLILKEMVQKDAMVDEERTRKRKFPDGINEGVSLLQNG
ncbi:hypothetical protein L1987_10620 [Smallanthus sonchifolius]|uniref:Uncharacterized protein n=1 Tax=Smallanthus sonchifolius TaxID=185202 RepID=A0ACB9JSL4_9ASTR|nr:hypothetical protein L1987_10620 [Smallanthus sonchifolius]